MEKWADRFGKSDDEKSEINNGYDHLIEIKELDGLTKTTSKDDLYDSDDPGLLVEWSVDEEERDSAIKEVKRVLTGDSAPITQSSVITEDDLPVDKTSS